MSILDRACKYNCPIEFTIRSCNYGWTKMRYKIQDNIFDCNISYIGMQPSIIIEALYIFSSYNNDSDGQLDVETEYEEIKGNDTASRYVETEASFCFDEEGSEQLWTIKRDPKDFTNDDFILDIKIVKDGDESKALYFNVTYRDMCYAVSQCFTKYLKEYGIYGYNEGTLGDDINIRQLLIIKGYALGILNNGMREDSSLKETYQLTFAEEMELLQMEM